MDIFLILGGQFCHDKYRGRCREICRLGLALSKNPERLLGSGDPWVANWQIGKLENHRLRVLHMVLNRCGLLCTVSSVSNVLRLILSRRYS